MTEQGDITRFGVMRHAPTVWNRDKRIQGHQNSPLTREGEKMALQWGSMLGRYGWHRILASDLGRTRQTAELINQALALPLSVDARLREKDWGEWTGKTLPEIRRESEGLIEAMENAGWRFRPPGGEDRTEVWERGCLALLDASRQWPGQKILVVTHEGMIKCLVYRLTNRHFFPTEPPILRRGHLHRLKHVRNTLVVEALNIMPLWREEG